MVVMEATEAMALTPTAMADIQATDLAMEVIHTVVTIHTILMAHGVVATAMAAAGAILGEETTGEILGAAVAATDGEAAVAAAGIIVTVAVAGVAVAVDMMTIVTMTMTTTERETEMAKTESNL